MDISKYVDITCNMFFAVASAAFDNSAHGGLRLCTSSKKENDNFHFLHFDFSRVFFAYVLLLDKQLQIDAKLENHKRNESIIFGAVFGAFEIKKTKQKRNFTRTYLN